MGNAKDLKLNFDTPPDEETILPDKKCDICYGRGIMIVVNPTTSTFERAVKECACITRRRVKQAQVRRFAKYRSAQ